jgi:raffinose/stachyose/melibiose transport system substrate-binding protein
MKKYLCLILVVVFVLSVALAGISCKGGTATEAEATEAEATEAGEKMVLNYWYWTGSEEQWEQECMDKWKEMHPEYEFVLHVQDQFNIRDTFGPALAAKDDTLDFARTYYGAVSWPLIDAGLLMPLEPYVEKYGWDEFYNEAMKSTIKWTNDTYYFVNMNILVTPVIFYNKDIFEEVGVKPPTSIAELATISEKITDAGYESIVIGYADKWTLQHQWNILAVNSLGLEDYSKLITSDYPDYDESVSWADPRVEEVYEKMKWMQEEEITSPRCLSLDYDSARSAFLNGEAAMISQGSWDVVNLGIDNPDLNYGYFPWPAGDMNEDEPLRMSKAMAVGYTIPSWQTQEKADAIAAFLDFLLQPEQQLRGIELGFATMRADLSKEDVEAVADPRFVAIFNDLEKYGAGEVSDILLTPELIEIMEVKIIDYITGAMELEEVGPAIDAAAKEIREREASE